MGKIIALTGCKGGCGTTVLTAALGREYAALGKKTCLVDMNAGLRALDIALHVQDRVVFDLFDLCEDECAMEQVLIEAAPNLHMIAAPQISDGRELSEKTLVRALNRLKKRFDMILLDAPCCIYPMGRLACGCADEIILVSVPGDIAARNTERACAVLREDSQTIHFVMNQHEERLVKACQASDPEAISAYLDVPLIGVIPKAEDVSAKTGEGTAAFPKQFREAVHDMALRLDGQSIPFKKHPWRFPWHS